VSRIGKLPVKLPQGVQVTQQGQQMHVKGPKGTLTQGIPSLVRLEIGSQEVVCTREIESRQARANHGLVRSLLQNMVVGVSEGYTRVMVIEGVGYRAELEGRNLVFNVGYSQPVTFALPDGVDVELAERGAKLTFTAIDKELIGHVCAKVRGIRPPEPYKGKGIRLADEYIRRKVGKAGVA
jgi:large subunit ribosomal protein L6